MKLKSLTCILILLFAPMLTSAKSKFSNLYVFGDSLSDTGNLAAVNLLNLEAIAPDLVFPQLPYSPLPPPRFSPAPYYDFRASNGPVAVEVLADKLGLKIKAALDVAIGQAPGTNYAVAGARAGSEDPDDLTKQIERFLDAHTSPSELAVAPDDALYVIMIGGNDVRAARNELGPQGNGEIAAQTILATAVNNIRSALFDLEEAGAKNIYVVNSPDIGLIPETSILVGGDPIKKAQVSLLTGIFNLSLALKVTEFELATNIDVITFDLFSYSNYLHQNSPSLGLTNNSDACYLNFNFVTLFLSGGYSGGDLCFNEIYPAENISEYAFFDEIHPTAFVHELIGEAMYSEIPGLQ